MTFFIAAGLLELPSGGWFNSKLSARQNIDATTEDDLELVRHSDALCEPLEGLADITLRDVDGVAVNDLLFTFTHYDVATRTLILAIKVNDPNPEKTYIVADLDRLFGEQYDPVKLRLGEEDTAYAVATLDQHFQPVGRATVIQTVFEEDAYGLCAAEKIPVGFANRLREAAA